MQAVALIHEEDGAFGVSFPDFPGATTVGRSIEEAIAKAAEALAFHVEGLAEDGEVPAVRTLSQLRSDPTFNEDAKGAAIAYVPYSPPTKAVRVNMTFDEGLLSRIDTAAQALGETRSGFLAEAARSRMIGIGGFQTQVGEPRSGRSARKQR
ncbi:MAG: type II toxin-antitoxin system HicB family antitoxin [Pseudolabrys sp.]